MTTIKFSGPEFWPAGPAKGAGLLDKGWFADAVGAGGWVISSIFPQRAPTRTGRDIIDTSTFGDYVPYILAGALVLILIVGLRR